MIDRKNIEPILKLIFDKVQEKKTIGTKELEAYIKGKVVSANNTHQDVFRISIESVLKIALDSSLSYRQYILKGDMTLFFSLFQIMKSYNNIKPEIFFLLFEVLLKFFKDQEPKLIITCANTLIKLLKNHNTLFLKSFTAIFEGLILLKLNPDQEVRNAGNALDEFLKDAIGNSYQGITADNSKFECDFSIDFLLQKLNKDNCHPAIQILIVSWITFIEAIPDLKIVNYLTLIIPELLNMLSDKIKDVYQCSEQCLRKISTEIEAHYDDLSINHTEILNTILDKILFLCKSTNNERVKTCTFEWILMYLKKYKNIIDGHLNESNQLFEERDEQRNSIIKSSHIQISSDSSLSNDDPEVSLINKIPCELFSKILEVLISNVYTTNKQIETLLNKANMIFQTIVLSIPQEILGNNAKQLEFVLKINLDNSKNQGIALILDWCQKLFNRFHCKMFNNAKDFIERFTVILPEKNDTSDKTFNEILSLLCSIAKYKETYSQTIVLNITNKLMSCRSIINSSGNAMLKSLSKAIPVTQVYQLFADILFDNKDILFVLAMINILDVFLLIENESKDVRDKLKKYDQKSESYFFKKIFSLWSYNPISTLIMCIISEYFELSYCLTLKLSDLKLCQEDYIQLSRMIQLIESSLFNNIRIKLLEPFKHMLLVKTLYAILMLLPQGQAYNALCNRLKSIEIIIKLDGNDSMRKIRSNELIITDKQKEVDDYLQIFMTRQNQKRQCHLI